jgi:hypothetical protein
MLQAPEDVQSLMRSAVTQLNLSAEAAGISLTGFTWDFPIGEFPTKTYNAISSEPGCIGLPWL